MKIMSILLVVLACNSLPKTTQPTENQTVTSKTETKFDTIVPAIFANGELVKIEKSEADWKKMLTEQEFYVLRKEGTERAFTGDLLEIHEPCIFICRGCGLPLFDSATKFDSGTGWPSFFQPIDPKFVHVGADNSLGMSRDEVECARCGGHLGHVFNDGPRPTGLRFCMNSVSMDVAAAQK